MDSNAGLQMGDTTQHMEISVTAADHEPRTWASETPATLWDICHIQILNKRKILSKNGTVDWTCWRFRYINITELGYKTNVEILVKSFQERTGNITILNI